MNEAALWLGAVILFIMSILAAAFPFLRPHSPYIVGAAMLAFMAVAVHWHR